MLTFAQPQPPNPGHSLSRSLITLTLTHSHPLTPTAHLSSPHLDGEQIVKKVFPPWSIPPHRTYITCLTCVILVPESGITHTLTVSRTSFHSVRSTGTCVKLTALALPLAPRPDHLGPSSPTHSLVTVVVTYFSGQDGGLPYLTPRPTFLEAPSSSASITRPRLVPRPSVIAHPFNPITIPIHTFESPPSHRTKSPYHEPKHMTRKTIAASL